MKQRTRFTLLGFLLAAGVSAQEVTSSQTPTVVNPDDNSAFTISESQLNDDDDVSKSIFSATGVKDDPFLDAASYNFGTMRFRLRGYDSQYKDVLINGVKFNNTELGRFNYSGVIGGLNDVMRNQDATYGLQVARFGFGDIGGASNYNIRPSQLAQGNKLTLSGSNRSYSLRAAFTHTQALANNYYVTFSTSYRWADKGYVDGTFYNAFAYFFAIEKV
ncbi:MAG: TonB-dependent receptor, partial [Bacteroidaceae bacterium]